MLSLRLKKICDYIDKEDIVLDVGTDHAYLPIYLKKNNLCKDVIASDISKGAINIAINNINKNNLDIKVYLSDGLKNIDEFFNTLVISGMGTYTIIDILKSGIIPDKIILSSNNKIDVLRKYMNEIGYFIFDETIIKENNKYYDIICYKKGNEKLSDIEILFGKSNDLDYLNDLYNKNLNILKKSNNKDIIYQNKLLSKLLKK